jgi:outer membrane protein OmpA-like peptidoglycan-associated protein
MSRSEVRTADAWRGYDRAVLSIALLGLLALLGLAWLGYGPNRAGCCTAPAVATSTEQPLVPPPPALATTPEPTKAEPIKVETPAVATAEPARASPDCARLSTDGVTVQFPFASAELDEPARATLDQVLACLNDGRHQVAGHASSVGDATLNQRLSEARARSVVAYFVAKGLQASRFTAVGHGQNEPIADNATEDGRAKNRRATLTRLP